MSFHEYSRLFTSGLLSAPSPHPSVSATPRRERRPAFLESTNLERPPKPTDSRTYSFLELADSLTSPVSPTDAFSPSRPLGHRPASLVTDPTAAGESASVRIRRSVLKSTLLNNTAVSPSTVDSFPRLSIVSLSAGQSFLITEPPLPDSPTLTRIPSRGTILSRSSSSTSLSIKSETKRMNRLAALACLEGREPSSTRTPRKSHSNFMNMSDDEDEDDSLASSHHSSADRGASQRLSTLTVGNIPMLAIMLGDEKEVGPLSSDFPVPQSSQESKMTPVRNRHRSRTTESWFPPFVNFIDLRNEEDPLNWRSFIEFSTATV